VQERARRRRRRLQLALSINPAAALPPLIPLLPRPRRQYPTWWDAAQKQQPAAAGGADPLRRVGGFTVSAPK
jgi:hypothetical protein